MLPAWPDRSSHRTLTNIYNTKNALNTTEEKHPHCMKAVHLLHWMTRAVTSPQEELCGHIASPNVTHTGLYFYLTLSLLVFFFSFFLFGGGMKTEGKRTGGERKKDKTISSGTILENCISYQAKQDECTFRSEQKFRNLDAGNQN